MNKYRITLGLLLCSSFTAGAMNEDAPAADNPAAPLTIAAIEAKLQTSRQNLRTLEEQLAQLGVAGAEKAIECARQKIEGFQQRVDQLNFAKMMLGNPKVIELPH